MSNKQISALAAALQLPEKAEPLLREALTHRTYAVEHGLKYDNQRLEFLGDAVLEIIQTEYLFFRYPDLSEGDMTKIRSALSCEATLAALARKLKLGSCLLIGNGEIECGGNERDSTLCDLFEAVLGAIYLGAGMEQAKKFVLAEMLAHTPDPRQLLLSLNPKGQLQELAQRHWKRTPDYRIFRHGGPQHQPFFEIEVKIDRFCALGCGSSRKLAEVDAAGKMVKFLQKKFGGTVK